MPGGEASVESRGVKRWVIVAAILVLVLASGGWWWRQQRIAAVECDVAEHLDARLPDDPADVVVVGDSYAAGLGLDDYGDAWPSRLGREVRVLAASGAGWDRRGLCDRPSLSALADGLRGEVVVLQGGLNDTLDDADRARVALTEVSVDAERIVVVGPPRTPAFEAEAEMDDALRTAAEELDATYVSLLDLGLPMQPDGMHVTEEGHRLIAQEIRQALRL